MFLLFPVFRVWTHLRTQPQPPRTPSLGLDLTNAALRSETPVREVEEAQQSVPRTWRIPSMQVASPGSPSYDIGMADLPPLRESYRTPRSTPRNGPLPEQPLQLDARSGEGEVQDSGESTCSDGHGDSSRSQPLERKAFSPTKHVNLGLNLGPEGRDTDRSRTPHKRVTPRKGVTPRQHQEDLAEVAELRALFGS